MKYQEYGNQRQCRHPWIAKLPEHWELVKLKYMAICQPSNVDKKTKDGETLICLCNYTDVYYNDEITPDIEFMKASATTEQIKKFSLCKDDVIITKDSEDPNDIAISAVVSESLEGVVCGYHLAMIRAKESNYGRYLKRVFDSTYARSVFASTSNGLTRYGLGTYAINNALFPQPPEKEQTQIATFLDRETQKIDRLIEKQQQLIKLLQEKRQAVISHAVTQGLNPNAKMKDSGVEWLGEIPEHWQMVPLKYLCKFSGGGTPSKDNLSYWEGGEIPWVSPKDMKTFWISNTQDKLTEKAVAESSTNFIENGALLMVVRSGVLQKTIPIAINVVKVTLNQDMKALRFNNRMCVEYAANHILGNINLLLMEWSKEGATVESIEQEYLSCSLFPVPPVNEQLKINTEVKRKVSVLQKLMHKANVGIGLLKERRTALISAAVTGKIDVRDIANG